MHGRGRMTIDPRILTMPGRSSSGFHRPSRQGGMGGRVVYLSHVTIDHASLSKASTPPTPNRLQRLGAHYVFSIYYIDFCFVHLLPFLFRRLWPPSISQDSDRSLATIYSSLYQTSPWSI